jgi:hypothetical protein
VVRRALLILVLAAGCGSFEDPSIVIDLRTIAMRAEPPEQMFDPEDPQLVDAEVCAVIADPAASRRLDWRMTVCAPNDELRCNEQGEDAWFELGRGTIDDPETAATPQVACATIPGEGGIFLVLEDAIRVDPLGGFSGIDVLVSLSVTSDEETIWAGKRVRYSAQIPEDRVANHNPTIEMLDGVTLGRCAETAAPLEVAAGEEVEIEPIEPDGVREEYVVPTFDGGSRMFTETISYEWLATAGGFTRPTTGGPHDASGMLPPNDTKWVAPDVDEPTDVTLWLIERDERLGAAWFEACVRVSP